MIFVGQEQYSGFDMEFCNGLGSKNLTSDLESDMEMDMRFWNCVISESMVNESGANWWICVLGIGAMWRL